MSHLVRYASVLDIPHIVELAELEHARSPWASHAFDRSHVSEVAHSFISGFGRTLIITDGGYLAGMTQHAGFSKRLLAMEYAWFSIDGSGLALLKRFEGWAKAMGAFAVVVHDYVGPFDEAVTESTLAAALRRRWNYRRLGAALTRYVEN